MRVGRSECGVIGRSKWAQLGAGADMHVSRLGRGGGRLFGQQAGEGKDFLVGEGWCGVV